MAVLSQPDKNPSIEVIESPDQEAIDFFEKRIEEFNVARWEIKEKKPIVLRVKNESGKIIAGAGGKTFGLWLLIDNLWVEESHRGQDLGSKVLAKLEAAAMSRGCRYVLLDTLNFQAKPFYEKHGYQVQWIQKNYPKEGCKYFMTKSLDLLPT